MRLLFFIFIICTISTISAADDWGRTGHRATGEIAEQHLSRKTKKAIKKLLGGESLAFVSTFADEIRSDKSYKKFGPWHYVNFPFGSSYEAHPKSEKGDVIQAINTCIDILKSKTSSQEDKAFYLRMLVHFVGDLHQPLHVGIKDDKGGNDFQVQWFGKGTNLHRVWDTSMIEEYKMSYTELAENTKVLSENQIKAIEKGTAVDWAKESRQLCEKIYDTTKPGDNLRYRYMFDYLNVVRDQLHKGGIRLAKILNDIYN